MLSVVIIMVLFFVGASQSQLASLDIEGDGVTLIYNNNITRTKTYSYEFSKHEIKKITCHYNKPRYTVELYDNDNSTFKNVSKPVVGNVSVSLDFKLENRDKTVICIAKENSSNWPRNYTNTLKMVYKKDHDETNAVTKTPTTTERATTPTTQTQSPLEDASSFLEKYGLLIGVGCAIVIMLCVVACCLKIMCSKTKPQPPEDHVNLTSDRGNDYNTGMAAPVRTMPKIEPNYCNPKDTQGRKNNADPNYSEAKEPQDMGEGLYAELNRPEDTYAEPYIDKTEIMYARPIPKALRKKKDDPNYSNVFGFYVNSKK